MLSKLRLHYLFQSSKIGSSLAFGSFPFLRLTRLTVLDMEKKASMAEQLQSGSRPRQTIKEIKISSLFIDFTVHGPLPVERVQAAGESSEQSETEVAANTLLDMNRECLEIIRSGERKQAPKRKRTM